jgi:hypothetical protein
MRQKAGVGNKPYQLDKNKGITDHRTWLLRAIQFRRIITNKAKQKRTILDNTIDFGTT